MNLLPIPPIMIEPLVRAALREDLARPGDLTTDAIVPFGLVATAGRGHKARIGCTRKATPGLRTIEKYAVRAGGGANHRFGLDDAVLIKDNHVAIAGGVQAAIERARAGVGHLVKIEVEVDTLAQLDEALGCRVDAVLLDNMSLDDLRPAVTMVGDRAITEASGRITPATASSIP